MPHGVNNSLRQQPWWTEADQAELDMLTFEFARVAIAHQRRCDDCAGGPWCAPLRDAFDAVLEWRHGRILRSQALALRVDQTLRETAA